MLSVFAAALDDGFGWLVVVAAANTVPGLFYCLRWLGPAFSRSGDGPAAAVKVGSSALTCAVVTAAAQSCWKSAAERSLLSWADATASPRHAEQAQPGTASCCSSFSIKQARSHISRRWVQRTYAVTTGFRGASGHGSR